VSPERLIIFAQRPLAGRANAGLVPPLSPDDAADLASECLRDVVARSARGPAALELWYEQEAGAAEFFASEFSHIVLTAQSAGDPGARLADAFGRAFQSGAEHVVVIGSDSPTLPDGRIAGAFDDVHDVDVVLGPTDEGGYYLVGVRSRAWPDAAHLFHSVPWASRDALTITMARAADTPLQIRLLPGWYDIDSIEDVWRARKDAEPDSHVGRWLQAHADFRTPPDETE
jgi:rSAM/selenodomain-associated transferase 1